MLLLGSHSGVPIVVCVYLWLLISEGVDFPGKAPSPKDTCRHGTSLSEPERETHSQIAEGAAAAEVPLACRVHRSADV